MYIICSLSVIPSKYARGFNVLNIGRGSSQTTRDYVVEKSLALFISVTNGAIFVWTS